MIKKQVRCTCKQHKLTLVYNYNDEVRGNTGIYTTYWAAFDLRLNNKARRKTYMHTT